MFIPALFILAKTWKQLTCPSTNDCLKKIIMQYHSIIANSEILTFAAVWMDLENIILSEDNNQKQKYDNMQPKK